MSSWFIPATWTLKSGKNHYYPLYTSKDGNRLFDNIRQLWHSAGMSEWSRESELQKQIERLKLEFYARGEKLQAHIAEQHAKIERLTQDNANLAAELDSAEYELIKLAKENAELKKALWPT